MRKWLALGVASMLSGYCLAEAKPTSNKEQAAPAGQVKREQKKATLTKFSLSLIAKGRLDPRYAGMPAGDIVNAIEKVTNIRKDEFETTANFSARKAAAVSGKFVGDLAIDDLLAFVLPVKSGENYSMSELGYKYNADTGEVSLFVLPRSSTPNGIGAPSSANMPPRKAAAPGAPKIAEPVRQFTDLDVFNLDFRIESQKTYRASNAFGANVTVQESSFTRLSIASDRIPFLNFKRETLYSNPISAATFNLDPAKAAKELPVLKAVMIARLADPYILYHFFHTKPTREDPTEMSSTNKLLFGDILGVVFYSGLTGEIFARLPHSLGVPDSKPEAGGIDLLESNVRDGKTGKTVLKKAVNGAATAWENAENEKRDAAQPKQDEDRQKLMAERERREVNDRAQQEAARVAEEDRKAREESARGPQWAESDNGADITWDEAKSYCASKGSGWRLPTVAELLDSYQSGQPTPCWLWTCKVASKSRLTGPWFWSNEPNGISDAWDVGLVNGERDTRWWGRNGARALCIRQP